MRLAELAPPTVAEKRERGGSLTVLLMIRVNRAEKRARLGEEGESRKRVDVKTGFDDRVTRRMGEAGETVNHSVQMGE